MVRAKGLEPSRLAAHAPQTCVSTIPPRPQRTEIGGSSDFSLIFRGKSTQKGSEFDPQAHKERRAGEGDRRIGTVGGGDGRGAAQVMKLGQEVTPRNPVRDEGVGGGARLKPI